MTPNPKEPAMSDARELLVRRLRAFRPEYDPKYGTWVTIPDGLVDEIIAALLAAPDDVVRVPEGCTVADAQKLRQANHELAQTEHLLRQALRFYANGDHLCGFETWEGPSGDENWLCPPIKDLFSEEYSKTHGYLKFIETLDEHMIEDGSIAKMALTGKAIAWDGDEPEPVKGEIEYQVALDAAQKKG